MNSDEHNQIFRTRQCLTGEKDKPSYIYVFIDPSWIGLFK